MGWHLKGIVILIFHFQLVSQKIEAWPFWCYKIVYYMAESARRQDEANPAFLLATRACKMSPSCTLGISYVSPTI